MDIAPQLKAAIQRAVACNAAQLPLLVACSEGHHGLEVATGPESPWPARIDKAACALITLISDDPGIGGISRGPTGWACAERAKLWAKMVIVHGAAGEPDHYRIASDAAMTFGRVLFVETDSAHADEWALFLACKRTLVFKPLPGFVHPSLSRETIQ